MTLHTVRVGDGEVSLTNAVMVMLSAEGLRIPGFDDAIGGQVRHAPLPLALPELLVLQQLAACEAVPDADDRRQAFLAALHERGLLVEGRRRRLPADEALETDPPDAIVGGAPRAYLVPTPSMFLVTASGFAIVDRDGRIRARLSACELAATSEFRVPATAAQARDAHRAACGSLALDDDAFRDLAARLQALDVLQEVETAEPDDSAAIPVQLPVSRRGRPLAPMPASAFTHTFARDRFQRLNDGMRDRGRAFEAEEQRERAAGRRRVRVLSVQQNGTILPLAIGMIAATARAYDGGRLNEHYAFHPDWLIRPSKVRSLAFEPGIFLFSNYAWSHHHNLTVSAKVKQLSPWSVTIHGGPNTPKYEGDCEAFFRDHPDVDVAVRGEGELVVAEVLAALAGRVGNGAPDLSVLRDIPGITFRDGGRIVRTPERERIADLDALPSPFLTGTFDAYAGGNTEMAIIETNRGCPYACTFCDWGSAINTKIRKFSLERVFAELEWCARNEVGGIMVADANFGIFERDVLIAEKVAALKEQYGHPATFSTNFAKNTTTHLKRIIEVLTDAGVISTSTIAMQSMDAGTLTSIRRANIKVAEYDKLAGEFRKADLPLSIDLMFGLPGQTFASFGDDLQGCIDRGVFPRMYMTELLVNSPMNDPAYREQHGIVAEPSPDGGRQFVVATSTFTRRDYEEMNSLRRVFALCEIFGMLREVAHYVRAETGTREIDFYDRLRRDVLADRESWPMLAFALRALPALLVAPGSWKLVLDDARRYLRDVLGIADDAALDTVMRVQLAVLPPADGAPAEPLDVPHDYAAWHRAVAGAKEAGHRHDWPSIVPSLRDFAAAPFGDGERDAIGDFGIGLALYGVQPETSITIRPQTAVNRM